MTLNGAGVTNGTTITGYDPIATAINGAPTYTVSQAQTIATSTINVFDIQEGIIFTCASVPVSTTGSVTLYNPSIYYVTGINTGANTITISETLNGPTYVPPSTASGTLTVAINQGLNEESYLTDTNNYFYTVTLVGDPLDPVIRLDQAGIIPTEQKITPQYGIEYVGLHFVKDNGVIQRIPYISAPLDTLYYQDATNPNRVGVIKLIENNEINPIDVETDILGKPTYTAKNGVVFTNGLKVEFNGDVIPRSYLQGQYYVEGVGTAIELIPVETLATPEPFTTIQNNPYDILAYDEGPFDAGLNIPTVPDYITIARNAINKNAWSRSNRWFHVDVINATAQYNNNPDIVTQFATAANKAKRPIIEFYPNLKLYNTGIIGKNAVDFFDTRTTDAFDIVEGQQNYYPDVQTYTEYEGTVDANDNASTPLGDILPRFYYEITNLGSTTPETWQALGAIQNQDGQFETGVDYIITDLGTTTQGEWNTIAGTVSVVYAPGDTFTATRTGGGSNGTGKALQSLFVSTEGGVQPSSSLIAGQQYTIVTLGTTQWQLIGASSSPYVGEVFTVTGTPGDPVYAVGTGTVIQGNGTVLPKNLTTIRIDPQYVTGPLIEGQYINDLIFNEESRLPPNTRIVSIDDTDPNETVMLVNWPVPGEVLAGTQASFVASTTSNADLLLFAGARIVFANDVNESVRNKIYVVNFSTTGTEAYPVVTLTEASDGLMLPEDQFVVQQGYFNKGESFYFDGISYSGTTDDFPSAQQKITVNQAPLFDLYDENGISYSNNEVYESSTFAGCKLFNYKLGVGVNDSVLGFPISYSSINNVGDISFEVSLNTQTFDYISDGNSLTSTVKNGYVYNYSNREEYTRLLGWQTAVAPSVQYQLFQFDYEANVPPLVLEPDQTIDYVVTLDVPQLDAEETVWPSLEVYNNNNLLTLGTDYTVENTSSTTVITIKLSQDINTPIQVLILSDKVSTNAYYTIPINLSNNPFNTDPTSVDIGDIRGQYQSIFENNPNTTGTMFGPNNYRDLGNMVPWGNRIIQSSGSLVLPGAFLRNPKYNLYDALLYNSREYIKFKSLLVDTINHIAYNQKYDPALLLDEAIDVITSVKSQEQPFFWSDMIPNKAPYITNIYTFANQAESTVFPLSKIYDFSTANYDGVLVYIQRRIQGVLVTKQLLKDIEYTISTDSPSVTVSLFLENGDKIIVKEYNQTYGSYIPNTPTKLGLYPLYIPAVVLDTTYAEPTYFIQGHDGSYNKLYGDYDPVIGLPVDFRDQALLEYETRVYNNIKLSRTIPIDPAEVVPGYFRNSTLTYLEWTEIYSKNFLDWIGQNRLDYKTQLYRSNDPWTYNYRESTLKLDNSLVLQGYWRGIYEYVYDTSTPNLTPWQMIGYANKPTWWEDRYGAAPYTSDNLVLWTDLQDGIDYNNGDPIVRPLYARPGLLDIIPVDDQGDLKRPLDTVIANYNQFTFQRDWRIGDDAPVEYSYRKSSTYPFDLMKLEALIRPAEFYNLGADLDNYKYNVEFNQFLVNNRTHLVPSQIEIYGNGTAKTSYINWIVDYEKQLGVNATKNIKDLLSNLDVRLIYRLAGFSDKSLLKFFVEKGSPDSRNSSLLIPDESYQVLLYENQSMTKLVYSGVIVQKVTNGYAVFGNNQTSAFFRTLRPVLNGPKERITVEDATVDVAKNYYTTEEIIPYGTVYYTITELSQFLMNYGAWLEANGAVFDDQIQNIPIKWDQMVAEFLYWSQIGWENGSVVTLNPSANKLTINKESQVVQPLTYNQSNFVLNNNLYPIQNKDLSVFRDGTEFSVTPLNEGDAIAYGQFNLTNIEHGIVFQNETLFNDVIYNLISGLRQNRIYVRGTKSGEWNGTLFASGFIYNQDNIEQWNPEVKYTKGSVVKYKNKFFTALTIVQPNKKFNETEWKETDYDEIQKGLLPNSSTRSYESALYYNTNTANLEKDADLLSFSLIGFRPREYMASADLTDITQVNVYKNMIKQKGTLNAMKAFKGAQLPQGGIDYDIYENWAILQGTFGGTLNGNFVEFRLNENSLSGNPSIVGLTNGNNVEGAQQLVPLYSLFNYGRPVNSPNILPLVDVDLPNRYFPEAGYVNIDDVKMSAYFYSNLPSAVNKNGIIVPIGNLYVRDYVWLADYQASWQILTPASIGQVVQVRSNLNNTCTVTFRENHNLNQYDIFAIINFDSTVNGYFVATEIINPREVLINLNLVGSTRILTGQGIGLRFQSQRVAKPGDINDLPLINSEFTKNKVWVDENTDGGWAVYEKDISYKFDREFYQENSVTFGSSVAYTNLSDFLFGDSGAGVVRRYQYDALTETYEEDQILTNDVSFGTTIAHEQNVFAISQPTGTPKVFLYTVNDITVSDNLIPYQVIDATDESETSGSTNFGAALALSGDLNWLFISDFNEATPSARNNVHVYRRSNEAINLSSGLTSGVVYQIVNVGTANWNDISTETISGEQGVYFVYNGDPIIGTGSVLRVDYEYSNTLTNGATSIDKFGNSLATNYYGTILAVGAPNVDYSGSISNYGNSYVYDRLIQNIEINQAYNSADPAEFTLAWAADPAFTTVTKNGILVDSADYSIASTTLTYTGVFEYGDIITISGNEFVLAQTLTNEQTPRIGVKFGNSLDTNTSGTELLIGAPFYLDSLNREGGVFRYTNGAARFGTILGTSDVNITTTRELLINGYLVTLSPGNATLAANAINSANITNVQATAVDGKIMIDLINKNLAAVNQELIITTTDTATLSELGLVIYTQTQIIQNPHQAGASQFGTTVKFNEHNGVAVSAPVGTRFAATTFDFSDDENYDNDTIFDNNATQFIDSFANVGAVYIFDYLGNYNESLNNIGSYIYAQSTNAQNLVNGSQPRYGLAIDWHDDKVVVGAPYYRPTEFDGQVVVYNNTTGTQNWTVYRQTNPVVDINRVENLQIFSGETNKTLINLDYIDPLQGKILGAVRQNIDVISSVDPAGYNNTAANASIVWGIEQVGKIWFDISNIRYLNYHQNDNVYNSRYWGQLFPGSDVAVCTWISSTVPPSEYQGPGVPKDVSSYTVQTTLNSSNTIVPIYYFWVRNTGIIFPNKQLSDLNIANYISNPQSSGISYMAPLASDTFALYNCKPYINANDSILHIGYVTGQEDNIAHQEFDLIRENYPADFLPGVPGSFGVTEPESLYDRLLDSMSGVDEQGSVVPDPFLPKAVQSGILARPRQSFFYNRFLALENYLEYANSVMALFPITEIRTFNYLNTSGAFYDTRNYWEYTNWWAVGYNDNTKAVLQVPIYADLSALEVNVGTIVTVSQNSNGQAETYRYDGNGVWTRIGLQNGTIRFKTELYDYESAGYGFGGTFYDTDVYDFYPSEETRWIIRALNEQIYTNELLIYRNKSLILLFEYIQEETIENQNYLPWLNKTSLIDVSHKIRELLPLENFVSDNQEFLSGYVNETKPYHVVVKEFLFDYTGGDVYPGILTDFDLPASYDTTIDKFVSPQLVYQNVSSDYQFLPDDPIWQTEKYQQWFENHGVSLVGQPNYPISKLDSYMTLSSTEMLVDNGQSFPVNGTIRIGDETITYASVDRATNTLSGLGRGADQTEISNHLPGEQIFMDLPPVILLNGGRGYANPPRVIAVIDTTIYPEPVEEAVLEAIMGLDSVVAINVINPGKGYAVQPEIMIDPAETFTFNSSNVNVINNTIEVYAPTLATGDLVKYVQGDTNIGGVKNEEYYYVNVLDSSPTTILALYTSYRDAVSDISRVPLINQGNGLQAFEFGARATAIVSSSPVRENNITLRFDRTSYNTQVTDWTPNTFYGSQFVGYYQEASSSSLQLASDQPDINRILASAEGTVFPVVSVTNEAETVWSSFERTVGNIVGGAVNLSFTTSVGDENPSGSTVGFTVGMPVKFTGSTGTQIVPETTYYVKEVLDLNRFTISATEGGSPISLVNYSPTSVGMKCYTAKVINTAVITSTYDGYRLSTGANASRNSVIVPLTPIGTGGTNGLYTNLPVTFINSAFSGLSTGLIYYVISILGPEEFTLSDRPDPVVLRAIQTNLASQIIVQNTTGLRVNDPVVFDSISINGQASDTFGNIEKQKIYYVKEVGINLITISETIGGSTFVTGVVAPADDTYCFITSQSTVKKLEDASNQNATLVLSIPVSPGQVNGQKFTFYPTSQNYADITTPDLTYGNLVEKTIPKLLTATNQIAILNDSSSMYNNIPFTVADDIGVLVTGKTYYAYDITDIQVECQTTTGSSVTFSASFTGTTMNVTSISGTGMLYPGTLITGSGVELNTYIVSYISGSGGTGTYEVSTTYFLPVSLTGLAANTGIITLAVDYDTNMIYEGMPIVFSNQGLGGILLNFTYYVRQIINSTQFTISTLLNGASVSMTTGNGEMDATGSPATKAYVMTGDLIIGDDYQIKFIGNTNWATLGSTYVPAPSIVIGETYIINAVGTTNWNAIAGTVGVTYQVNDIVTAVATGVGTGSAYIATFTATGAGTIGETGQATVVIPADVDGPVTWNQEIVSAPTFDVGYTLGGYSVIINNGGVGFTQNNIITIPGTVLGGMTPDNDLTIQVNQINAIEEGTYNWSLPITSNGTITSVSTSGTPIGDVTDYYLKVTGANTFKVYSDPLLQLPVSGIDFPYQGYTEAYVTGVTAPSTITLTDSTGFDVNDSIVFTGLSSSITNLVEGQTYYVTNKVGNNIQVSDNPAGTAIVVYPSGGETFTGSLRPLAAKPGSFALLPEPFYFNPSIVRYNNRLWICVVSNNDSTFTFGKWELLNSGDRRLNALDRAEGYYSPTVNMPGRDLTQLFTGLTYPNTTYKGNNFEPDQQYPLDTQLIDTPFDVQNVDMPAIIFDGNNYMAPANLPNYAAVVADIEIQDDWSLFKLANQTLALTDLIKAGNTYVMTSNNSPTPLFKSVNQINWSTNGWYVPYDTEIASIEFLKKRLISSGQQFNAVTHNDGLYIAVGSTIVTSDDTMYWFDRLEAESTRTFHDVAYVEASNFTGYVAVGNYGNAGTVYTSTDGIEWSRQLNNNPGSGFTYKMYAVTEAFGVIYGVGEDGIVYSSTDALVWVQENFSPGLTYRDIHYGNGILVAVGDNGLISARNSSGSAWITVISDTTENLNSLTYVDSRNEWTIVGDNNTVLQTSNIYVAPPAKPVWDTTNIFSSPTPDYIVQGDAFLSGYGPEEMVPGIVTDQLTMIVNTRAGTNWEATEYAHVGYNVISLELDTEATNEYSFANAVSVPAYINVFLVSNGLSVTLYDTTDYTVDWINKTVTPNTALSIGEQLRIDVYEVGNGDQLIKSNTENEPIEVNAVTGFSEILLDCNYTNQGFTGGGIVQPGSSPISVTAIATDSIDDTIECDDVSSFTLNDEIYFAGTVFGGVAINTPYYVKSINNVRQTITISTTLVSDIAGPVFNVSTDSGSMSVVIEKAAGQFYTEPAVFHNGTKLIPGLTNFVIATSASTQALTTFSTAGLLVDQPIRFSNTIFGDIDPLTTYYVYSILSATEFMIRDNIGNPIYLTNGTGTAIFITNDYAVTLAENQINPKVMFAEPYTKAVDYVSYSFFGPSEPLQYGYTLPQTQQFLGQGIVGPYVLSNYVGGVNATNAVVEINGLRIDPSEYTIDFGTTSLVFGSLTPTPSDTVAVTTFNDTHRQYLFTTTYDTTTIPKQVTPIVFVNNNVTVAQPTVRIETSIPHNLVDNDIVRIDGVVGSSQLNNQVFRVEEVTSTILALYEYTPNTPYTASPPITIADNYVSGGYVWKLNSWILENQIATDSSYDGVSETWVLTVNDVSELVPDTPVYFTEYDPATGVDVPLGDATSIPEIIAGTKYYIKGVNEFTNEFSISEEQGGTALELSAVSGVTIRVTQWEQTNVDRLWVTVNGQRVTSSNLRLNDANEVSILTEILPGDEVIITSMMPSATPNSMTYIQIVDQENQGTVYRANSNTRTWLTEPVGEFTTTIKVDDISKITNSVTQTNTCPAATLDYHEIGLIANRFDILEVRVYNNNPARLGFIDQDYIEVRVSGLGPFVLIQEGSWIEAGDSLTITTTEGRTLYVNGEYMTIISVDQAENLLNVQRGAQGSAVNISIPKYTTIYSLLADNQMSQINYNDTWNPIPGIYNTVEGDPLQIAVSPGANFLKVDVT